MTLAVEAQDLFRVHSTPEGDAAALQGLTLSVAEGEILTVLGPSGAGKTLVPADPRRARPALGRDDPRLRPEPALARTGRPRALPLARSSATSTSTTSRRWRPS